MNTPKEISREKIQADLKKQPGSPEELLAQYRRIKAQAEARVRQMRAYKLTELGALRVTASTNGNR